MNKGVSQDRLKDSQKWLAHKYQLKAKRFLVGNAVSGLFLDPG
jgi:hypothetical protein